HAGSEGELFPSTTSLQSSDSICTLESCILEATGEGDGCEDDPEDSAFCLPEDALSGSLSITDEIMELLSQRGLRSEPINGETKAAETEGAKAEDQQQESETRDLRQSRSTEDLAETEKASSASLGETPEVCSSGAFASLDSANESRYLEPSQDGPKVPSDKDLQNKENGESPVEENKPLEMPRQAGGETIVCRTDDTKLEKVQLSLLPGEDEGESSKTKEKDEGKEVTELQDKAKIVPEKKEKSMKVKRDSTLTPDDRLLIERIKNYYETADAGASYLSKEESISYIPTGVVKDSILRFNYILQQEVKKDREKSKCKTNGCATESKQANCQRKPPSQASEVSRIKAEPNKEGSEQESEYKSCAEIRKAWKEKEKPTNAEIERVLKRGKLRRKDAEEPGGELVIVEESDLETGGQSPRDNPPRRESVKEPQKVTLAENINKLDSQAKTGCDNLPADTNKATFCSSGIGLYDADDICLIENSEKIINKVQLLAKMYSEKIGRMKTQKKNGGTKTPETQKKATVKTQPQVMEEHTGERRVTEPKMYGHLMIHETLLHINCVQENGVIHPAIRESALDLLKKESLMTPYPEKEQAPLLKPPEIDEVVLPTQEISPTEIDECWEFSIVEGNRGEELPVNYDSAPHPTSTSEESVSDNFSASKTYFVDDKETPVICEDCEERETCVLEIKVPEKVNLLMAPSTLHVEPTSTIPKISEEKEIELLTSEGSNALYPTTKISETSDDVPQTIGIINTRNHDDIPQKTKATSDEPQTDLPITNSCETNSPAPIYTPETNNHFSSDCNSVASYNTPESNTSDSHKVQKAKGVSSAVMDVMQRLQLDSSLSTPSPKNINSSKKLNMATRSSSFKGNTSTAKEFQAIAKPKSQNKKQQAVVATPGLLSPSILHRKLSRAVAMSKNNPEPQQALPRRPLMTKSRSSDSDTHTPVIKSQPSVPGPSPYRNSLYSGLLLSDPKPRVLKNTVLAENQKDGEANQLNSKITQSILSNEGSLKPLLSGYKKGSNTDRPVCLSPGSPVLIAIPCPPPIRQTPASTVSEPNSRVQSPLTLRSRMFSPPPSQNPVCPKSRAPSFSKTRSCSFTPLSFSNLERSSSSSANSTPTCTSPPPRPWSPGFPTHSRRSCGSSTGENPISPRALYSPIGSSNEENKFWCSSRSPPCLASDSNSHTTGISSHELTSIHWPDVRELRTKYGPFKTQKSSNLEKTYDLKSSSSFRQCKSLDEGPNLFFNNSSALNFAASHSPTVEPSEIMALYESTEKLDSSDPKEKSTFKASYSTTVNIQIGGSGRIASFSNAQVSLTHPLLQAPETLSSRKININGSTLEHKNVNYRKK
ncbi:uncharacterized protein ACNLHF_005593, partial [Anomaloglossus baeobatrachus]|uniref:uncharacterized protein LOC142283792 n=1 Tax=Anomaloglossus baeobatrachus TaxID=238106 RepID=UPI003F5055AE